MITTVDKISYTFNDLLELLKQLKKHPRIKGHSRYSERVEYMIIKVIQLDIIDRRIRKNIRNYYNIKKNNAKINLQQVLYEMLLDTETFFYTASKLINLFFEGLSEALSLKRNLADNFPHFKAIQKTRSEMVEHSHKNNKPLNYELNQFGFNSKYGPYLRSGKLKGVKTRYVDRAYIPLKNGMIKELKDCVNVSLQR